MHYLKEDTVEKKKGLTRKERPSVPFFVIGALSTFSGLCAAVWGAFAADLKAALLGVAAIFAGFLISYCTEQLLNKN